MSANTIIHKEEKKLTIKGLTSKQKEALLAGGLSFAALGMGVGLFKLFNPKPSAFKSNFLSPVDEGESLGSDANYVNSNSSESRDESGTLAVEESLTNTEDVSDSHHDAEYSFTFYSDVEISSTPNDAMSFEEAFKSAREDVGTGGFFNYRNESFSTFYEDEWNGMSPENQRSFFEHVAEKSDFTRNIDTADEESIDSIVEEYEIVQSNEGIDVDNSINENIQPREHIVIEPLETKTTFVNEGVVDMENDDFFDDLNENDLKSNSENLKSSEGDEIDMENDDFFNSLDSSDSSSPVEQTDSQNDIDQVESNNVIVKPIYGLDSNDDDIIDMVAIDNNEDGIADVVALDENYDGKLESFMINEDGGQNLDVFVIDQGLDGIDDNDIKESIDDIVSMDDFVVLGENDVMEIENLDMIENLIDDSSEITQTESLSDETEQDNFEDPGL